jgi:molecular chaperone HscA
VEAVALITAGANAIEKDGDLLSPDDRAEIDGPLMRLRGLRDTTDHRRIKEAIEALNTASEAFAGRRMDRAISGALSGRRVDDLPAA